MHLYWLWVNALGPRQNSRHFPDDTFKRIFLNENVRISNKISLKFVPKFPIDNIPALVQKMAWRRPGDKPLSEPMMVKLPTHVCVTRPQWVYNNDNNNTNSCRSENGSPSEMLRPHWQFRQLSVDVNISRPPQNGRHLVHYMFDCIFFWKKMFEFQVKFH